ncbi:prophage tail fiber N-terminal domain-containing protein [Enterobacter hormaechei]|uniref:prophage tail fiber N-terminal domain-containing protein n=1 Tax=Enterobacter hormaechei TaxID=158836 RepID=UPI0034D2CE98
MSPIRVYGQLIGPMLRPGAGVKILLKAITTNQLIVQDTWSESSTDSAGNYDFSLTPGKYAVFFERNGVKDRVQNIQIYSDSAPGNLQSFMLAPAPELLTPLVVLEARAVLESTSAAMMRARQWAENPVDVPVLDFEQGAGPEYSAYHWAHKAMEALDTDTNINWRGEWKAGTAYAFRDGVRWRPDENTAFSSYYCTEGNTGHAPPTVAVGDNEYWSLMAAGGAAGKDGAASTVPGPANTITIGTVIAVDYGTLPKVTLTGTSPNQVLNFQLETGPKGAKGDKGDKGDPGSGFDASDYYTKEEIDAMISGGTGGVVDPGSVGAYALVTMTGHNGIGFKGTVSASNIVFSSLYREGGDGSWMISETSTSPAGTWKAFASVILSNFVDGTYFLAQRVA